jgi:hypothetical protein
VNEVPEGANVLIETEGATKRLPSTAINNGYAKDEVYNKNEAYSKEEVYNKTETYSKDEVYNKTEADNKFLTKETIAKPDWNQNNENAPDYVKNRTHWEDEDGTVHKLDKKYLPDDILNRTHYADKEALIATISFEGSQDWSGETDAILGSFEFNQAYQIIYNGNEYLGIYQESPYGGGTWWHGSQQYWPFQFGDSNDGRYISCDTEGEQFFEFYLINLKKLDGIYLDDTKLNSINPKGQGSLQMNPRTPTSQNGASYGNTFGRECAAYGIDSLAEGLRTNALGAESHAEGYTDLSGNIQLYSSSPRNTTRYQVISEDVTIQPGDCIEYDIYVAYVTQREDNIIFVNRSLTPSVVNTAQSFSALCYPGGAIGDASHSEGRGTCAYADNSHAQGKYNLPGDYAHVVGNGTYSKRSNAHTLDWEGNAWYAGMIEGTAVIIKSSTEGSTKRFKITVDDNGTISATEVAQQ